MDTRQGDSADPARRAVDDPATLARAARVVRTALARRDALDAHIEAVVDAAPPLTDHQTARLRELLAPEPK